MRHPYVPIIKLALPILVGQIGSIATGFVDNIMVGHYSTNALASASFCNNLFNIPIMACMGFTFGVTPLVGAFFTAGEKGRIGPLLRNAVWLNVVFCLAITAVMIGVYFNIENLGQPEELIPIIKPYFLICASSILPVVLFNVFAQWSYGINNTRMPMWIILGANALNVLGNYALIFGHFGLPEMGLTGAGISTLAARLVTAVAIIGLFFMRRNYSEYRAHYRAARLTRRVMSKLFHTSIPVSLQMSFETAAFSGAAVICGFLGAVPLAAFQIVVITGTLGFCIYYSVGAAVAVRVANARGAGSVADMRRNAWAGYHIILAIMLTVSLLFVFGGPTLMSAFTEDPAVLSLAVTLIFPMVLYQVADATQINFANALRGTANVMPMLWISFVSYLVFGLPSTYLMGITLGMGVYGIVLSFSVSLVLAAIGFLTYFLRTTGSSFQQKKLSL